MPENIDSCIVFVSVSVCVDVGMFCFFIAFISTFQSLYVAVMSQCDGFYQDTGG